MIVPFLLAVTLGNHFVTTAVKDLVERARPTLNPIAADARPVVPERPLLDGGGLLRRRRAADRSPPGTRRAHGAGRPWRSGFRSPSPARRVLLDVHWVSDVVAGLALGWAWFALCAIAFGGRLLRFGAAAEAAAPAADRRRRRTRRRAGRGVDPRPRGSTVGVNTTAAHEAPRLRPDPRLRRSRPRRLRRPRAHLRRHRHPRGPARRRASATKPASQQGALQTIADQPFGHFLLVLMAIGLGGYALWRFAQAIVGTTPEAGQHSALERVGAAGSAIAYGDLLRPHHLGADERRIGGIGQRPEAARPHRAPPSAGRPAAGSSGWSARCS